MILSLRGNLKFCARGIFLYELFSTSRRKIFIILEYYYPFFVGRVAESVKRLTKGWTVRALNPGGARFSARPDRPWGPPSLLYNGYRVFLWGKVRPGRAADHSPLSTAAVMEE